MQTIEYRTQDKSAWPRGAWDDEPDKLQWRDEATGLPCLVLRNRFGALCGYVGVPAGHPWHGAGYDDVRTGAGDWPDVHGGLTFSGGCEASGDPAKTICHVPADGEPDEVWWLGFDCAGALDLLPGYVGRYPQFHDSSDVYRDLAYVRAGVAGLAAQAERAEPSKPAS